MSVGVAAVNWWWISAIVVGAMIGLAIWWVIDLAHDASWGPRQNKRKGGQK